MKDMEEEEIVDLAGLGLEKRTATREDASVKLQDESVVRIRRSDWVQPFTLPFLSAMTTREREISFGLLKQGVSSPSAAKWCKWSVFGNIYHICAEPDNVRSLERFFTNIVDRGIRHVISVLTDLELSAVSETIFPPATADRGAVGITEVGEWTIEHVVMSTNKIAVVHSIRVHSKKNLSPAHDLTHTQVHVWPDGARLSADVFQNVFNWYSQAFAEGPTLVHCKHGLGRSASLVIVHALMTSMKNQLHVGTKEPKVSIFDAVSALRRVRSGVIGNAEHYANLHDYLHAVHDLMFPLNANAEKEFSSEVWRENWNSAHEVCGKKAEQTFYCTCPIVIC